MNKEERMLSYEDLAMWCSQFDHHDASKISSRGN
jgi:hypothetical protein